MKKMALLVIVLLVIGLLGFRVYQKKSRMAGAHAKSASRGAVAVVVQAVETNTIRDTRVFTGTIFPHAQFDVAPKVAGRLESLLVDIGSEVKKNDLIATLDSQEYKQQVEQAKAELDVAKASGNDTQSALDIASREQERTAELRKQQVASVAEMDQVEALYKAALAKHEIALAKIKQQEAALKAAEIRLSYTQIHATWDGGADVRVIGERYVDEGSMLSANEPMASVLDIETVLAAIFVVERDYPYVLIDQPAIITTDAFPGKSFEGKIIRRAPMLKESSRQARIEIEIPNPDRQLAPGMFVRAEIQFALHEKATTIPVAALAQRNDQRGVFLADLTTMTAQFVPVSVGIINDKMAELLAPPIHGQVVTLGQHLLEDGVAIIIPAANADSAGSETPQTGNRGNQDGERR